MNYMVEEVSKGVVGRENNICEGMETGVSTAYFTIVVHLVGMEINNNKNLCNALWYSSACI